MLRPKLVQSGAQMLDDCLVRVLIRALLPRGRHLASSQFADDAFPRIRVLGDIFTADPFQVQPALLGLAIVATNAIVVYQPGYGLFRGDKIQRNEENREA